MNELNSKLEYFVTAFRSYENDISVLKKLCDSCTYLAIILDIDARNICYVNQQAEKCFGYTSEEVKKAGVSFAETLIHPEFSHLFPLAIAFFANPGNSDLTYSYMYLLNTANGWQWTYACSKIIESHKDGSPKYILALGCNINKILENNISTDKLICDIESLSDVDIERFKKISKRELEILRLISEENTTNEIAKKLFISKATVDSHRKNLLKKLNVKSAIGLAKYILLFDSDNS